MSRPYSEPCNFVAEVQQAKIVRQSDTYELTLNPKSVEQKDYCKQLDVRVLEAIWYDPQLKLQSGELYKPNQPPIVVSDVLKSGSIIKGTMDSYDHTIENVVLVSKGTEFQSGKYNVTFLVAISTAFVLGIIALIYFVKLIKKRRHL